MRIVVSLVIVGIAVLVEVHGHTRFVCPPPQSPNSGQKRGICGGIDGSKMAYMEVKPGPMTLRYEETIYHRDAPTSIRLLRYGEGNTFCTLLDHIPHNNAAKVSFRNFGTTCKIRDYPIGQCSESTSYITVIIPDIECDNCYLQIRSVMTDKYNDARTPCFQITSATNNCSTYYSCANIKIRPSEHGTGRGLESCQNNQAITSFWNTWPYMPQPNKYQPSVYKDHGVDFAATHWFPYDKLAAQADMSPSHPVGPCAPPTETYVAIVNDKNNGMSAYGAVSFTTRGQTMTVSGMVVSEGGFQAGIDFFTRDSQDANTASFTPHVDGHHAKFSGGRIIDAKSEDAMKSLFFVTSAGIGISSNIVKGFQSRMFMTRLGDVAPFAQYVGEAVFVPTAGGFHYSLMIDLATLNATMTRVSINGPQGELYDLTSSVMNIREEAWYGEGNIQVTNADLLLNISTGYLSMHVETSTTYRIHGDISSSTTSGCDKASNVLCQVSTVTSNGTKVDRVSTTVSMTVTNDNKEVDPISTTESTESMTVTSDGQVVTLTNGGKGLNQGASKEVSTNGMIAFYVNRNSVIEYSGYLTDLSNMETIVSIVVWNGNTKVANLTLDSIETSGDKILFQGQVIEPKELILLSQGRYLEVAIETTKYSNLRGNFPPLKGAIDNGKPLVG